MKVITRRQMLQSALAGSASFAVPQLLSCISRTPEAEVRNLGTGGPRSLDSSRLDSGLDWEARPYNVLFICIDDLNDWVNVWDGHPQAETPNIARLAGRGVSFTNAHCSSPACNPSRTATMTGLRPSTTGVYLNNQPWRQVLEDTKTLPEHFRDNGYSVLGAGKMYHDWKYPDPRSWDEYFPSKCSQRPVDPMPDERLNPIPSDVNFDWGPLAEVGDYGDSKVADWISAKLSVVTDTPQFLACGFYRPHLPWFTPQAYFDRFPLDEIVLPMVREDDLIDIPAGGLRYVRTEEHTQILAYDQWKPAVQGYLASLSFMDEMLGRVIDGLDASGRLDDTVVVLWSDHGWHLGEKLTWRKFTLWEEATRSPLIMIVPGLTGVDVRCTRPVSLLDIYPTLIELCGLTPKPELEGTSLLPYLRNPAAPSDHPRLTTWERNNHSVRSERWRFTRYSDGTEELYDHDNDPNEWDNLADDSSLADIRDEMSQYLPTDNAENVPSRDEYTEEELACVEG